jgi:hypothetical protein
MPFLQNSDFFDFTDYLDMISPIMIGGLHRFYKMISPASKSDFTDEPNYCFYITV